MKIINIVWLGEEPGLHQGKTMDHDLVEQIVTGMTPVHTDTRHNKYK